MLPSETWRDHLTLNVFAAGGVILLLIVLLGPDVFRDVSRFVITTGVYCIVMGVVSAVVLPRVVTGSSYRNSGPGFWIRITLTLILVGFIGSAIAEATLLAAGAVSPFNWRPAFLFRMRFTVAMSLIFGLARVGFDYSRRSLLQKNRELQEVVAQSQRTLDAQSQEMQQARVIQQNLLPRQIPQLHGIQIATAWQPAREVGGDYFDVFPVGSSMALCVGDVVGKGITAALLMSNLQATVKAFSSPDQEPSALCGRINSVLGGNMGRGKFITFFYGVLDPVKREMKYCRAGHNAPLLLRASGDTDWLREGGPALGMMRTATYEQGSVFLGRGDRLILYTDGIVEAMSESHEEFGEERMVKTAVAAGADAQHIQAALIGAVERFCDGNYSDDATLVVVSMQA